MVHPTAETNHRWPGICNAVSNHPKPPKEAFPSLSHRLIRAQGHPEAWVNGKWPGSIRGQSGAAGGLQEVPTPKRLKSFNPPVPDSVVEFRLPRSGWATLIGLCRLALARPLPKPRICNTDRCAQAQLKQLCLTALPGRCASGVLHDGQMRRCATWWLGLPERRCIRRGKGLR